MAALYSNENFPWQVVSELRARGHDVLTSLDARQANLGIPDDRVLAFATTQGRALLTFNRRDFIRLHRRSSAHAGVMVCTQDSDEAALTETKKEEARAWLRQLSRRISGPAPLATSGGKIRDMMTTLI